MSIINKGYPPGASLKLWGTLFSVGTEPAGNSHSPPMKKYLLFHVCWDVGLPKTSGSLTISGLPNSWLSTSCVPVIPSRARAFFARQHRITFLYLWLNSLHSVSQGGSVHGFSTDFNLYQPLSVLECSSSAHWLKNTARSGSPKPQWW